MKNEMINKILDNYYSNKLNKYIKGLLLFYTPSFKIEKQKNRVYVYIKKYKYKDEFYKEILNYNLEDSLFIFNDIKKLDEIIKERCKAYMEEN